MDCYNHVFLLYNKSKKGIYEPILKTSGTLSTNPHIIIKFKNLKTQ